MPILTPTTLLRNWLVSNVSESPIFVEFSSYTPGAHGLGAPGTGPLSVSAIGPQPVSLLSLPDIAEKSSGAVNSAMSAIKTMGDKFADAVAALRQKPSQVEMEFSLTFDIQAGAIIAKTRTEGSLKVTLTWKAEPHEPEHTAVQSER